MSDTALRLAGVPEPPLGGRLLADERLARLVGRGSERAFAALYERHHQAIYRYCRSIVHDDHDAQDAMQSAMMRAYAALRERERELAVKPWLFRIAHNESVSILRRRRPEQQLSEQHEQPDSEPHDTIARRERLSTLVSDLQSLPERQRAALLMRELSGLSIQEIAAALQLSPGAAKQTLFEARSSLHELAQGRAMQCETVMQAISQRDGRVLRSRRMRSHLRACNDCRAFREAIATRSADLAAIAPPLPAALASALLARLLAQSASHAGGATAAGSSAATAGSSAATAGSGIATGGSGIATGSGAVAGSGASLGGHIAASMIGKALAGVAVLAAATAGTVHLASSSHSSTSSGHRTPSAHASGSSGASGAGSISQGASSAAAAGAGTGGASAGGARGAGAANAGMDGASRSTGTPTQSAQRLSERSPPSHGAAGGSHPGAQSKRSASHGATGQTHGRQGAARSQGSPSQRRAGQRSSHSSHGHSSRGHSGHGRSSHGRSSHGRTGGTAGRHASPKTGERATGGQPSATAGSEAGATASTKAQEATPTRAAAAAHAG